MQAIEHLIVRNKELEQNYINPSKARFSYYDTDKGKKVVIEGFIPKSKVRERIKELEKCVKHLGNDGIELTYKENAEAQIEALQSLLED